MRQQSVEAKIKAITRALNLDFDSSEEILALLKKQESAKKPDAKAPAPLPERLAPASKQRKAHRADARGGKYGSVTLKIQGLEPLVEGVMKATFQQPTSNDSAETRQRKMEESNFNTRLLHVVREAITIATSLSQRQSAAVAGPMGHDQALELAHLLDKAYSGRLAPIGLNPHLDPNQPAPKIHPSSKLSVAELFPITSEKVKKMMTQEAKARHPYPPISILVAPKRLVVTICERETSKEMEKEFALRNHEAKHSRSSISSRSQHQDGNAIPSKEDFYSMGASTSVVIQELIQLVRCLIDERDTKSGDTPVIKRKNSYSEHDEIGQNTDSWRQEVAQQFNSTLERLIETEWHTLTDANKQSVIGLLSVVGGWQSSMRTG